MGTLQPKPGSDDLSSSRDAADNHLRQVVGGHLFPWQAGSPRWFGGFILEVPVPRPQLLTPRVGARDHLLGTPDAPITLVQYADFECPFCGRAFPEIKEVLRDLGAKVRFVFRHFPMVEQHPHAEAAAELSEAAAAQGKFWDMHDLLFQRQAALEDAQLLGYARELKLDVARVERELREHVHRARVRKDFNSGIRSGVSGTPMFFINGRRHEEPGDARTLRTALLRTL